MGMQTFVVDFHLAQRVFETPELEEVVLSFEQLSRKCLSAKDVARETEKDPLLSKVKTITLQGWSSHEPSDKE